MHTSCCLLLPSATLFARSLFYHSVTHRTPNNLQKILCSETVEVTVSNLNALGEFVSYLTNSEVVHLSLLSLLVNDNRQAKVTLTFPVN